MGRVIGIDLGTTNTLVCSMVNGEPVVVKTSEGDHFIPSVVRYDSNAKEFFVGQTAKDCSQNDPGTAVYSIKRLMGMH